MIDLIKDKISDPKFLELAPQKQAALLKLTTHLIGTLEKVKVTINENFHQLQEQKREWNRDDLILRENKDFSRKV